MYTGLLNASPQYNRITTAVQYGFHPALISGDENLPNAKEMSSCLRNKYKGKSDQAQKSCVFINAVKNYTNKR